MKNIRYIAFSVVATLLSFGANAQVSGSVFLSSPDLSEPSEVLAYSFGASQSGSFSAGGGGGAGKANFQDISITRYTDATSALFLQHIATGDSLREVLIEREGLTITLRNVLVTSYSSGGFSGKKKDLQTENVSLNFAEIEYEVNGNSFCWSPQTNATC